MKKIILLALVGIASLGSAKAQETYNSSGGAAKYRNQEKKGFDVNKLIFGGGLGFGMGNGSISFGISPVVGYRITDNFSAGVSLGYQYLRVKDYLLAMDQNGIYHNFNLNLTTLSGGVWARYLIWQNLFAHVEFENNYSTYKEYFFDHTRRAQSERLNQYVPCLLLGGGFRQPISDNASFVVMALYDVLQNIPGNTRVDQQGNKYSISPYARRLDFRVGLNIGF